MSMPQENPYAVMPQAYAAMADADARADFITKTYLHLLGAVMAFVALEAVLFQIPGIDNLVQLMVGNRIGWLVVLGLFIGVSYMADNWAMNAVSPGKQYLGLGVYVVAESIIFLPILYILWMTDPSIIFTAATATGGLFLILTAVVFLTRADFSFLRGILIFGGLAAMGLIVVAILFNFQLGVIFTYAMIALACGYILYHTSNVLHHYRIGQHVAASLALFAAVALLFWYLLRLFSRR